MKDSSKRSNFLVLYSLNADDSITVSDRQYVLLTVRKGIIQMLPKAKKVVQGEGICFAEGPAQLQFPDIPYGPSSTTARIDSKVQSQNQP